MREILFRGKPKTQEDYYYFSLNHKDNCKDGFVFGSLVVNNEKYYICVFAICNMNFYVGNGTTSMVEVIPETAGQFTGLTDKNGKKIFDGDIVKHHNSIYEISYITKYARFAGRNISCIFASIPFGNTEVIGNIHDNPELLKGGEVE